MRLFESLFVSRLGRNLCLFTLRLRFRCTALLIGVLLDARVKYRVLLHDWIVVDDLMESLGLWIDKVLLWLLLVRWYVL